MKNFVASLIAITVICVHASGQTDHEFQEKRDIHMLRMGKRELGLLRMGRSVPLLEDANNVDDDLSSRQVLYIPRTGRDVGLYELANAVNRRAPPLPRLGSYLEEYRRYLSPDDDIRQVYSIPRLGRYRRSSDEKRSENRAVPLPRLGYMMKKYTDRATPLPRLGYRELSGDVPSYTDDVLPSIRIGENDILDESEFEKAISLLHDKLTKDHSRATPLPRLGQRDLDPEEEKRAMGMLRMGKRELDSEMEKRAMGMLRMGKRAMGMLRMGKRNLDDEEPVAADKRAMSMLRMGKRELDEAGEKRAMGMLRMGKRPVSMLRMGKRDSNDSEFTQHTLDEDLIQDGLETNQR